MLLRYMERVLFVAGAATLAYCSWFWLEGAYAQARGRYELRELTSQQSLAPGRQTTREGALFGQIEIPELGIHAVIFEGTTDPTLARGVGHLTGSARPGESGNVVLAAHRDTFFRPLRKIEMGDQMTLHTLQGSFRYRVESIGVVQPDAVAAIQPTKQEAVTLITCYPFSFIGNAPERYIVRAVRVT